jgi:hypothetical protein
MFKIKFGIQLDKIAINYNSYALNNRKAASFVEIKQ